MSETTEADKLEEAIDLIEPCFVPMGPGGDVDAIEVVRSAARRELGRMREMERLELGSDEPAAAAHSAWCGDGPRLRFELLGPSDTRKWRRVAAAALFETPTPAPPLAAIAQGRAEIHCARTALNMHDLGDVHAALDKLAAHLSELEAFVKAGRL